ncbi:hypothetical protein CMU20_08435 [Elizabethkingia anophelis]|nr:hypothetical protein [Elizabethkingia anophelis]
MKKNYLFGVIGLIILNSCSRVNDSIAEDTPPLKVNNQMALSTTRHSVLAESIKVPYIKWGESESLVVNSPNNDYRVRLTIGSDCNMGIYFDSRNSDGTYTFRTPIWTTNTIKPIGSNPWFTAQLDGNLVLYSQNNYNQSNALWSAQTNSAQGGVSNPKFKLQLLLESGPFIRTHTRILLILEGDNTERATVINEALPYGY